MGINYVVNEHVCIEVNSLPISSKTRVNTAVNNCVNNSNVVKAQILWE